MLLNKKIKQKKLKVLLLISFCLVFAIFSGSHLTKAKYISTKGKVFRTGSVIIDSGTLPYTVPEDSDTNYETGWPSIANGGYFQTKSKKPHFEKKDFFSISTHINSVSDADFFMKDTDNHLILNSYESIGAFNAGQITYPTFNLYVVKTDGQANHLKRINLFDGTDTWRENAFNVGWVEKVSSEITEISKNRYGLIYFGQKKDDLEVKNRLVTFDQDLNHFSWKELTDESGNGYQEPAAQRYLQEQKQEDGTNLLYGFTDQSHTEQNRLQVNDVDYSALQINKQYLMDVIPYETVHGPKPSPWYIYALQVKKVSPQVFTGIVRYASHGQVTGNTDVFYVWDQSGHIINQKIAPKKNDSLKIMTQLSSQQNKVYFQVTDPSGVDLIEYDAATNSFTTLNTFAPGTDLTIYNSNDTVFDTAYEFNGYVSSFTNGFSGFNPDPGTVLGTMDEHFKVINVNSIPADNYTTFNTFKPTNDDEIYFITGQTKSRTVSTPVDGTWVNKVPGTSTDSLYGTVLKSADYAPGLKFKEVIIADITNSALDWDQVLLKGVEVTDTYDLDPQKGNKTQDWLNKRINRNPLNTNLPIDWETLGLNKTERGPQKIKYFVTDSSMQTTAASRWINKIDENTDYEKANPQDFLSALNFDISIDDVASLNNVEAKAKAKLLLWDTTGKVSDDGTASKNIVAVNQVELQAIKDAKSAYDLTSTAAEKATYIRPYPLTFTHGDRKVQITVFITDDTTKIENHLVIYGFNFEVSIKKVKTITSSEVISLAAASVWNQQMKWGDQALPITNLSVDLTYTDPINPHLTGLNQVTEANQAYHVKFDYKDTNGKILATNHLPEAYAYGSPAKIHLRQVILRPQDEMVIPTTGYLIWENMDVLGDMDAVSNTKMTTITDDTNQTFEAQNDVQLEMAFNHWLYRIKPVIPEYYQYEGYLATTTKNTPHHEINKILPTVQPQPTLDFSLQDEYWVTIYLTPATNSSPKPYSWDYQVNSFGKLVP